MFQIDFVKYKIKRYPEFVASFGSTTPNYQGMFLRGYGLQNHIKNNGTTIGNTNTIHCSEQIGIIQGDAQRQMTGWFGRPIFGLMRATETGGFAENIPFTSDINDVAQSTKRSASDTNWTRGIRLYASRIVPTANENRPVNIAVKYLIRVLN